MVYPILDHTYLPYLSARAINYTLEYGIPAPCFLIHVHYGPRNQASFLKLPIISKIVPELLGFHAILNRKFSSWTSTMTYLHGKVKYLWVIYHLAKAKLLFL